jgi:hypothetical protein
MSGLKQPWLGIGATVLIIGLAFLAILPWSYSTFGGVFSDVMMCMIPVSAVIGMLWQGARPQAIAQLPQPLRGATFTALGGAVGTVAFFVLSATIGGGKGATPFLGFGIILSVVVTFMIALMWGCWPFTLIRNKLLAGLAFLATAYAATALLTRTLNFAFLAGAPFYGGMDPAGPIPAWDGLVGAITCLAAMFVVLHFDLPVERFPRLLKQPVLGLLWTVAAIVVGWSSYLLGTRVFALTPDAFLVTVPVPFIFGSVVLLTPLGGSATRRLKGPAKGAVGAVVAMVLGSVLARIYVLLMPVLTRDVPATQLDHNLWLATALLGVTFPFLAWHHDYFQLWPLLRATSQDLAMPGHNADGEGTPSVNVAVS